MNKYVICRNKNSIGFVRPLKKTTAFLGRLLSFVSWGY